MKNTKKWLGIVGNVLLWLFVVFAVVMTVLVFAANANKDGIPSIGGKSPISIESNSMSPTFKAGDLIVCEIVTEQEKAELAVNDVITYFVDLNNDGINEINTHRIIDKYENDGYVYYITQGDNKETNPTADAPTAYYDVICKWTGTRIPVLGSIISFLRTSLGFLLVIVLPLLLFFLYEVYRFIRTLLEVKGVKSGISEKDEEEIKRRAIEEYLRSQQAAQPAPEPDEAKAKPDEAKAEPDEAKAEPDEAKTEPDEAKAKPDKAKAEPDEVKTEQSSASDETSK